MSISMEASKIQRQDQICWDGKWYTVLGKVEGEDRVCLMIGGFRIDVHRKRFLDTIPRKIPKTTITKADLNDLANGGQNTPQIAAERLA